MTTSSLRSLITRLAMASALCLGVACTGPAPAEDGYAAGSLGGKADGGTSVTIDEVMLAMNDYMTGSSEHGATVRTVDPADLGKIPDYTVRYYQLNSAPDFDWKELTIRNKKLGFVIGARAVYDLSCGLIGANGYDYRVFVFNNIGYEADVDVVLSGNFGMCRDGSEHDGEVTWDARPQQPPQLIP